jgi:hypothetical protein
MWHVWETGDVIQVFRELPEKERPLGSPGLRWENNIEMNLKEVE